jgi:hypothetical protein
MLARIDGELIACVTDADDLASHGIDHVINHDRVNGEHTIATLFGFIVTATRHDRTKQSDYSN